MTHAVHLTHRVERSFVKLPPARQAHVRKAAKVLAADPFAGDHLTRALIPRRLQQEGVQNLWRLPLPDAWRLLYTVATAQRGDQRIVLIVFIGDHGAYDRLLGYA